MAELYGAPFRDLVTRLYREPELQDSIFDLPRRFWHLPDPAGPDLSVAFHGRRAGNPGGPAAGPHTQMAQNLVLAWLGGARIMEFKTIQINDRLTIPRPCIDMVTVGYNVEWSQELRVHESIREYVAGMMLIEMLRRAHPCLTAQGTAGETLYDLSVGYNLAGIKSAKVQHFLDAMRDATPWIERLRSEIPAAYGTARELDYPRQISASLTLSTFHGCPADEIERICEFLIAERGLDVIVKMNPPMLGRERLEHLLHDVMGYTDVAVHEHAYSNGLSFEEGVAMIGRLRDFGARHGRGFGCKFSNTLEVVNQRKFFPPGNEVMYLSGTPLHVITLTLADLFRQTMGPELPITFSAGVDQNNFAACAASGFAPITVSSDLLKTGGYGRLYLYYKKLAKEMLDVGAATIDEFAMKWKGQGEAAKARAKEFGINAGDAAGLARLAGFFNTTLAAEAARNDDRYRAAKNAKAPKRIDSKLVVFDCLTCYKCVPVCPNGANFSYPSPKVSFEYRDYAIASDGKATPGEAKTFTIEKDAQIANYADFCNECGNCDTFCPEYGGPYIEKPGFYGSHETYQESAPRDGFYVQADEQAIIGRIKGVDYRLTHVPLTNYYVFADEKVELNIAEETWELLDTRVVKPFDGLHGVAMHIFHSLRYLRQGVLDKSRVNQINVCHGREA